MIYVAQKDWREKRRQREELHRILLADKECQKVYLSPGHRPSRWFNFSTLQLLVAFDREIHKDIKHRRDASIASLSSSVMQLAKAQKSGPALASTTKGTKRTAAMQCRHSAPHAARKENTRQGSGRLQQNMTPSGKDKKVTAGSNMRDCEEEEDLVYALTLKAYRHLAKLKKCLGHELLQSMPASPSSSSVPSSPSGGVHPLDLRSMRKELERCAALLHPSHALPFRLPSTALIPARSDWITPPPPLRFSPSLSSTLANSVSTSASRRLVQTLL